MLSLNRLPVTFLVLKPATVEELSSLLCKSYSISPALLAKVSTQEETKIPSAKTQLKKAKTGQASKFDVYGPPDPLSNIQTVKFYIPADETSTERNFRLQRDEVQQWNHQFWEAHNKKFFKEKAEFVKTLPPAGKGEGKKSTPAEQMAVFYRKFLNDNRQEHLKYNKEWYKKNISLLWPAFLVFLIRQRRRFSSRLKS